MAGETVLTIVGNLTADPELRTTGGGATVASFTIASTPRNWNRQANQFEDGPAEAAFVSDAGRLPENRHRHDHR
mgnify:CR=1 FL=1